MRVRNGAALAAAVWVVFGCSLRDTDYLSSGSAHVQGGGSAGSPEGGGGGSGAVTSQSGAAGDSAGAAGLAELGGAAGGGHAGAAGIAGAGGTSSGGGTGGAGETGGTGGSGAGSSLDISELSSDFEDGTVAGWSTLAERNVVNTDEVAQAGTHSIVTVSRAENWDGPSRQLYPYAELNKTYAVSLWVRLSEGTEEVALSVKYSCFSASSATTEDTYARVGSSAFVSDSGWTPFTGTVLIPSSSCPELVSARLYLETVATGTETVQIYVDEFTIEGL